MRVQIYTSETLAQHLEQEATRLGDISISSLVIKILEEHYNLTPRNNISLSVISARVFSDVEKFLNTISNDTTFTLNEASETLRNLPMINVEKPSTLHASIGRAFSYQVRKGIFSNKIDIVRDENGNALKDSYLRATIYIKHCEE